MNPITQKEVRRQLYYDPIGGVFTWIAVSKYHSEKLGCIAGGPQERRKKAYWVIGINGKKMKAHRLAFLYMTGLIPDNIDHRNGCSMDNRWDNIVACTHFKNTQNHMRHTNGSGLPCGVRRQPNGRFSVRIQAMGRVFYLGAYDSSERASEVYEEAKQKIHYCPARRK